LRPQVSRWDQLRDLGLIKTHRANPKGHVTTCSKGTKNVGKPNLNQIANITKGIDIIKVTFGQKTITTGDEPLQVSIS